MGYDNTEATGLLILIILGIVIVGHCICCYIDSMKESYNEKREREIKYQDYLNESPKQISYICLNCRCGYTEEAPESMRIAYANKRLNGVDYDVALRLFYKVISTSQCRGCSQGRME